MPRTSQPKEVSYQSPRVSTLDRLGLVNIDLRDYLSNKQKLRSEETIHISPSQCGQAGYQLVMVHSIHYCLGTMPITFPPNQQSVFNQLSARTSEKPKSRKKKATKVIHLAAASVNIISRGRDLFWSNEEDKEPLILQLAPRTLIITPT